MVSAKTGATPQLNPSPSKSTIIPTIFFIVGWWLLARLFFLWEKTGKNEREKV
ncbi:MAG UNVERIFIED_CONTAM: hypothetical protein LVR29_02565 [Microcystis novacekii LVE1205-3]|jgi:hypothetical protein